MRRLSFVYLLASAAAIGAPTLHVDSHSEPGDTGTMHYVDELSVGVGDATPLILASDVGGGVLRPVPGPQYSVGDNDVVLLGWSSWGGGMQTVHAMLFHVDGKRVALRGELTFTGGRRETGFVMRRDGLQRMLLGIPEPSAVVHEEDEWALRLGPEPAEPLKMEQIRKLPFVDATRREGDQAYFPPFGSGAGATARVAWISVDANGFAISADAR